MTEHVNKETDRIVRTLHELHMQNGQSVYFSTVKDQLKIRNDQRLWLEAHLKKIQRLLSLEFTDRFLDFGCGEGFFTLPLSNQAGQALGVDFVTSSFQVMKNQEKYNQNLLDLTVASTDTIPIRDNCVDKLLCNHVLEHVIDDDAVVREMYRIIKPHGLVLIGVPLALNYPRYFVIRVRRLLFPRSRKLQLESVIPGKLTAELIGVQSHIRFYSLDAVVELLERNNFEVLAIEGIGINITEHFRNLVRKNWVFFKISIALGYLLPGFCDGVLILARRMSD